MFARKLQIRLPRTDHGVLSALWAGRPGVAQRGRCVRCPCRHGQPLGKRVAAIAGPRERPRGAGVSARQERRSPATAGGNSRSKAAPTTAPSSRRPASTWPTPTGRWPASRSTERGGTTDRWGEVVRVEYVDDDGVPIHEYRSPLKAGETVVGTLRLGIAQPSVWSYLRAGVAVRAAGIPRPGLLHGGRGRAAESHGAAGGRHRAAAFSSRHEPVARKLRAARSAQRRAPRRWVGIASSSSDSAGRAANRCSSGFASRSKQGRHSRLDAVLNSIPDGVATTDDGRPADVHQSADGRDAGVEGRRRQRRRSEPRPTRAAA